MYKYTIILISAFIVGCLPGSGKTSKEDFKECVNQCTSLTLQIVEADSCAAKAAGGTLSYDEALILQKACNQECKDRPKHRPLESAGCPSR